MKVTVEKVAACQKRLVIEVPPEKISEGFSAFYSRLAKTAEVPGFRKGKAPRQMLEQHYQRTAREEVLSALVNDAYQQALTQEKLKPVESPAISDIDFQENKPLKFHATVDIAPEFELKTYRGLKLNRAGARVGDEELNQVLDYLRDRHAQFLPVEGRPAQMGDYLIADYQFSVDGRIVDKKEKVWLWLSEQMFIPAMAKELVGVTPAQTREFDAVLPEHYHPPELAGKTARASVSVAEIKEKKLPDADDAFATTMGAESMTALRERLHKELTAEKQSRGQQELKRQVIDQLVQAMPIEVPPLMVQHRIQTLQASVQRRMKNQGMADKDIAEQTGKLTASLSEEAVRQIRAFFILERIAEQEKITVEEKDIEARIAAIAESSQQKKEAVFEYLHKNNMLDDMYSELWEGKLIDFLVAAAAVTETELPDKPPAGR